MFANEYLARNGAAGFRRCSGDVLAHGTSSEDPETSLATGRYVLQDMSSPDLTQLVGIGLFNLWLSRHLHSLLTYTSIHATSKLLL